MDTLKLLHSIMGYKAYLDPDSNSVHIQISGQLHKTGLKGEIEPSDTLEWVEEYYDEADYYRTGVQ